jgi:hypothetical protein
VSNWQLFFVSMAIWNVGLALPGLIAPRRGFRLLYGVETDRFYELYQHWAISAVILLFGVGYAIIAIEPSANLGLVLVGVIAKVLFAAVITVLFFLGRATKVALAVAVGDIVFAVFFIRYLQSILFFVNELVAGG